MIFNHNCFLLYVECTRHGSVFKHGGDSVMLWGYMFGPRVEDLHFIDEKSNQICLFRRFKAEHKGSSEKKLEISLNIGRIKIGCIKINKIILTN